MKKQNKNYKLNLIDKVKNKTNKPLLIKISILIFFLSIFSILILEKNIPNQIDISQINQTKISTPISVNATINPTYSTNTFSILNLKDKYNNTITGTIQENITNINSSKYYLIIGKVSRYKSEKQIEIYQILSK